MSVQPSYNERAWAIDVITEINLYSANKNRAIIRAGGEYSLAGGSSSLFPDVLLFGDVTGTLALQGWELKMPDTAVNDVNLISNAEEKARRLGLNSFVVWNANEAVLYQQNLQFPSQAFKHAHAWPAIGINSRKDVQANRVVWIQALHQMMDDMNEFIDNGSLQGASAVVVFNEHLFLLFLEKYTSALSSKLNQSYQASALLAAQIDDWWLISQQEYLPKSKFFALAQINIIQWLNRFLFAHYLKKLNQDAKLVELIDSASTLQQAIDIFSGISAKCDFLNIFKQTLALEYLDDATWQALTSLNALLTDSRLETLPKSSLQAVVENALNYSRKKLAGQFSTPKPLADLLVRVTIENRNNAVYDPCCGTGTIARAAFDLKREVGLSVKDTLSSTWASDKYAFPLQLSTIAMTDPQGMNEVVQVFKEDVFNLGAVNSYIFTDPKLGIDIQRPIPKMHAIVSNLPFVRFEDLEKLNVSAKAVRLAINTDLDVGNQLSNKSDLYAYVLLYLRYVIEDDGKIGVIISNAWLGADWGQAFRKALLKYFSIINVVVSAKGRWFANAKVVTTLLVLQKRVGEVSADETINFITTQKPINRWLDAHDVKKIAQDILLTKTTSFNITAQTLSLFQVNQLEQLGVGWSAMFTKLDWISQFASYLIPASQHVDIARGARRGWDKLFYPDFGHGIEAEFIQPVLENLRTTSGLIAMPNKEAFCCSEAMDDLLSKGSNGAIAWIERFATAKNEINQPLPEVLALAGHHWYEMKPTELADFVVSVNPDKRLCVHRFETPAFVNQRLIRFTVKNKIDIDILHALLNSTIGMFLLEAAGFGRGLGALDLNATKLAKQLHVLNHQSISQPHKINILNLFKPLLLRDALDLPQELASIDRQQFDEAVLQAYGFKNVRNDIYQSLLALYNIRQTARETL
jgi:type I restriction-modification system DNA methylase subunit